MLQSTGTHGSASRRWETGVPHVRSPDAVTAWYATPQSSPRRPQVAEVVVVRWASLPHAQPQLQALLRSPIVYRLPGGSRLVCGPFTPLDGRLAKAWRARGRISPAGIRVVPYARVAIEVIAYGPQFVEINVRPRSTYVYRWGCRRSRRYFSAAHLAADAITASLRAARRR